MLIQYIILMIVVISMLNYLFSQIKVILEQRRNLVLMNEAIDNV